MVARMNIFCFNLNFGEVSGDQKEGSDFDTSGTPDTESVLITIQSTKYATAGAFLM